MQGRQMTFLRKLGKTQPRCRSVKSLLEVRNIKVYFVGTLALLSSVQLLFGISIVHSNVIGIYHLDALC